MGYPCGMPKAVWRDEVAKLLEQCAQSVRTRGDRQAASALGTALGYLQRAEQTGDLGALALMGQVRNTQHGENTQRFSFAPGELEELTGATSVRSGNR